jgi:hypothetical protein
MEMECLNRMNKELSELESNLYELDLFLDTKKYMELSETNKRLLSEQSDAMGRYSSILRRRIKLNE